MKTILVTGGCGFIGSHTVLELLESGYEVVVLDNLENSSVESLKRIEEITKGKKVKAFYQTDLRDEEGLRKIFADHPTISAVIHFAGLKAVGESVAQPLEYYDNNVSGTVNLLRVMRDLKIKNIVFSSSATVYGDVKEVPKGGLTENLPTGAINPYGRTKLFIEEILRDVYVSDKDWNMVLLRYFNPVGAHPSGLIGEDPKGIPNNLMPYILQVAIGKRPHLNVFGSDYPTKDGTGVRDYIHVVDLAKGHIAAIKFAEGKQGCCETFNLGTGNGYSVLEMAAAVEKASGRKVPYKLVDRRPGDAPACFASPARAKEGLNWSAELGIDRMCEDGWRWQKQNPEGYKQN